MERHFVGLDVAKDKVDVHVRPSAATFTVANDEAGRRDLVTRLEAVSTVLIVLEATGDMN